MRNIWASSLSCQGDINSAGSYINRVVDYSVVRISARESTSGFYEWCFCLQSNPQTFQFLLSIGFECSFLLAFSLRIQPFSKVFAIFFMSPCAFYYYFPSNPKVIKLLAAIDLEHSFPLGCPLSHQPRSKILTIFYMILMYIGMPFSLVELHQ